MVRRICAGLGLLATLASAQPQPGDWVLSSGTGTLGGLYWVSPPGNVLNTLATLAGPGHFNCVTMVRNNADLLTAHAVTSNPCPILVVSPQGVLATVATASVGVTATDVDQDGRSLISCGWQQNGINFIGALDLSTGVVTSLVRFINPPNGFTIDHDTGDYVTVLFYEGSVLRINRVSHSVTTLVAGLGNVSGVDFEPRTGSFVVTRFNLPGGVLRVSAAGSVTTIASVNNANGVKVDDATGNLLVCNTNGSVSLLTPAGVVLTTRAFAVSHNFSGVELYGSRKVSGSGPLTGGAPHTVDFSFPGLPGAAYVAAMSLAERPGIPLPDGRVINLAIDPLLQISIGVLPGITTGFAGALDGQARATGTITLPAGFPAGVRFFVSAAALNPGAPGGIETANTIGLTSN
jgi:hypothetical protein